MAFVDEYGGRIKEESHGYSHIPEEYHDELTAWILARDAGLNFRAIYHEIPASEFVKMQALSKAAAWRAPSKTEFERYL